MAPKSNTIEKYGHLWNAEASPLAIELECIARRGNWIGKRNQPCGAGLFEHMMNARSLAWPKRYRHRWTDLLYQNFVENSFTVLMGCASSAKTSTASEFALLKYWSSPEDTMVLLSTTTVEKLKSGIFGEVLMLWEAAHKLHPFLAGHVIDYKQAIATDNIEEEQVRDLRRGVMGKACYSGKQYVGLAVTAGLKQTNVIYVGDEIQFCSVTLLDCLPNLFSNPNVTVIVSGNPRHDPDDQLGIAAEPKNGWASLKEPDKTQVWDTNFYNGKCVNLVGTDSPNFDQEKDIYPKLIGRKFASLIEATYGKNSPQYYAQVKGVMRIDLAHDRVITRELCRQHGAHDKAVWAGTDKAKVYGVDPAYGGGDRCIKMVVEFGTGADGSTILRFASFGLIPIDLSRNNESPEDQIAAHVFEDLRALGIPAENCFYDSFGKGTIGFAFARKFGQNCPVPVDSGGQPTKRAVRADLYTEDETRQVKRLKRCDEHYSKFVTEMWFSVRYAIEANQVRELPVDVMLEGCMREYETVAGNKIEVEPKADLRERLGKSPDLMDCAAICVEGARRRGFTIARLGPESDVPDEPGWFEEESREYEAAIQDALLTHV